MEVSEEDKAFLYGSAARNEETGESDIDVLLGSRDFKDRSDDRAFGKVWRLTRKVDSRIESYAIGLKRFNQDDVSSLLKIVIKEGVLIS